MTNKCEIMEDPKVPGLPYFETGLNIANEYPGCKIDNKLDVVSLNSDSSKMELINYYMLMYNLLKEQFYSNEKNDILTYLDMGYVPVYYAPEYVSEDIYRKVKQNIINSGVNFMETPFTRLSGKTLVMFNECRDIWCYKPDIMTYYKQSLLSEVNVGDFLFDMLEGVD